MKELDCVALVEDLPEYRLKEGDIGAIVHLHDDPEVFEVEFVLPDGGTAALITVPASMVRPIMLADGDVERIAATHGADHVPNLHDLRIGARR